MSRSAVSFVALASCCMLFACPSENQETQSTEQASEADGEVVPGAGVIPDFGTENVMSVLAMFDSMQTDTVLRVMNPACRNLVDTGLNIAKGSVHQGSARQPSGSAYPKTNAYRGNRSGRFIGVLLLDDQDNELNLKAGYHCITVHGPMRTTNGRMMAWAWHYDGGRPRPLMLYYCEANGTHASDSTMWHSGNTANPNCKDDQRLKIQHMHTVACFACASTGWCEVSGAY